MSAEQLLVVLEENGIHVVARRLTWVHDCPQPRTKDGVHRSDKPQTIASQ